MMMYPILYMLIWTIPTAIRIYQGTSGRSASLSISCVDKVCQCSFHNIQVFRKTNPSVIYRPVLLSKVWQTQLSTVSIPHLVTRRNVADDYRSERANVE